MNTKHLEQDQQDAVSSSQLSSEWPAAQCLLLLTFCTHLCPEKSKLPRIHDLGLDFR